MTDFDDDRDIILLLCCFLFLTLETVSLSIDYLFVVVGIVFYFAFLFSVHIIHILKRWDRHLKWIYIYGENARELMIISRSKSLSHNILRLSVCTRALKQKDPDIGYNEFEPENIPTPDNIGLWVDFCCVRRLVELLLLFTICHNICSFSLCPIWLNKIYVSNSNPFRLARYVLQYNCCNHSSLVE